MRTRRKNRFNRKNSQYLAFGAAIGMLISALVGVSIKSVEMLKESSNSQTVRSDYYNKG